MDLETASRNVIGRRYWALGRTSVNNLRWGLRISAWVRWFVVIAWLAQLHHQVNFSHPAYIAHTLFAILLLILNGYIYYRVETKRMVSWRWVFALSATDAVMLVGGLTISSGFDNAYFVLYFVPLALFAIVCTSISTNLAATTVVAGMHSALSLSVEPGGNFYIKDELALLTSVMAMYALVAALCLVSRFEQIRSKFDRTRRREAVEREQELQKERIELSQTIHDTIAQSAFTIGLGLETAIELAAELRGDNGDELVDKLEGMLALAKSTMWELRHPIDAGAIFQGRELNRVLRSHASTFAAITSIPTEFFQSGTEQRLSTGARRMLFSIAHNAMTNALRHSRCNNITIMLTFRDEELRLSVSDDGVGLPEDYADHGHGFRNMETDAERMGGSLEVGPGESGKGTTVACVIPYDTVPGGG